MKRPTKSHPGDGFDTSTDHLHAAEHALLTDYLVAPKSFTLPADSVKFEKIRQLALFCAAMERIEFQKRHSQVNPALTELVKKLAGRKMPYTEAALIWNISHAARILAPEDPNNVQRIHLGSGNILMEPNDQYLCIVPDRKGDSIKLGTQVFLPFEGDSTLSLILSKAFLLADDANIQDQSIVRQIGS